MKEKLERGEEIDSNILCNNECSKHHRFSTFVMNKSDIEHLNQLRCNLIFNCFIGDEWKHKEKELETNEKQRNNKYPIESNHNCNQNYFYNCLCFNRIVLFLNEFCSILKHNITNQLQQEYINISPVNNDHNNRNNLFDLQTELTVRDIEFCEHIAVKYSLFMNSLIRMYFKLIENANDNKNNSQLPRMDSLSSTNSSIINNINNNDANGVISGNSNETSKKFDSYTSMNLLDDLSHVKQFHCKELESNKMMISDIICEGKDCVYCQYYAKHPTMSAAIKDNDYKEHIISKIESKLEALKQTKNDNNNEMTESKETEKTKKGSKKTKLNALEQYVSNVQKQSIATNEIWKVYLMQTHFELFHKKYDNIDSKENDTQSESLDDLEAANAFSVNRQKSQHDVKSILHLMESTSK